MNKTNQSIFLRCYYNFFISGMTVLVIGAILPLLIEEANLNYTIAGSLLSYFAIGNLLSSFITPILYKKFGRKKAVAILSSLVPLSFAGLIMVPQTGILYLLMLLIGIGRGSISNFNNAVVGDYSNGKTSTLNILHTCFAFGAFLSPLLTSVFLKIGFNWKQIIGFLIILCMTSVISFLTIPIKDDLTQTKKENKQSSTVPNNSNYLKNFHFYCVGLILFFYLGMENCINGWFVTYLKDTGIMEVSYARNLVSITWLVIMIGRLICAYLSKFINKKILILVNCIGSTLAFLLLISTTNLSVITISLIIFGFFLAGIYPTCVSNVSALIKGSASGMAVLMGISALGGIITPKIIGVIADRIGMVAAIGFLAINVAAMILFAIINFKKHNS